MLMNASPREMFWEMLYLRRGLLQAMLWGATELHSSARKSIQDLFQATPGSTGLDLSSSIYIVLTPEMGIQALPTGVYGPLLPGRYHWSPPWEK